MCQVAAHAISWVLICVQVLSALDCLLQPGLLLCTLAPGNLLGRSADTMAKTTVETSGRAAAAGAGGNTAECSAAAATGQRLAAASAVGNFPAVSGDVPVAVLAPTAAGSEGISGRNAPEPMAVDHPDEQQSLHMPESQPLHHSTAGASGSSSVLQQSVGTDSRDASIGNIAADGASSALPTVASPSNVSASVNSMCTTIGTATSSAAWRSQADALQSTWPHARHHALQYSCSTSAGVRVPPQLTRCVGSHLAGSMLLNSQRLQSHVALTGHRSPGWCFIEAVYLTYISMCHMLYNVLLTDMCALCMCLLCSMHASLQVLVRLSTSRCMQ